MSTPSGLLSRTFRTAGAGCRAGPQALREEASPLDHVRRGVEAEACDAEARPEVDNPVDLVANVRVVGVQARLEMVEAMVKVGPRLAVIGPDRVLLAREDRALAWRHRRRVVCPDVVVAVARGLIRARRLKPGMLVRRVLRHQVDHHAHAVLAGSMQELDQLPEGPEPWVDLEEIGDIITVVAVRGRKERQEPETRDTEFGQVGKARCQSGEIADPVAVPVGEAGHVDAVDDRVLPPCVGQGWLPRS